MCMVHEIREKKLSDRLRSLAVSPFFIPAVLLFFFVLTIPVISLITSQKQDIRQNAAPTGPTATIKATPSAGSVVTGQSFSVDIVVDGGGQTFNAAQAHLTLSNNLIIQSVTSVPQASGGCNFTYVNQGLTPTVAHPSFVGAILNGSSTRCTAYTLNLQATGTGTGTISIINGSVKSSVDHSEIFSSVGNASFVIGATASEPIAQSDLLLSPSSASVTTGQTFTVDVRVNSNGQTVNGVQSNITYPIGLLSVASINSTAGVFDVKAQQIDDGNGTITLAFGAFTPQSGSNLLVATITFLAKAPGSANVVFQNPTVISNISNKDVLKNYINGVYAISGVAITPTPTQSGPTPTSSVSTPTPTTIPTSTAAPTPTATPIPPTATPTPSPIPTSAPSLTPTNTPGISVTIGAQPTETYKTSLLLWGTKTTNATSVFVNNSSVGLSYPSNTTWQVQVGLSLGANNFSVYGQDALSNKSTAQNITLTVHKIADINGDTLVDIVDLSIFGVDWANTGTLNNVLSDMNDDAVIDLTDFSILASAYEI